MILRNLAIVLLLAVRHPFITGLSTIAAIFLSSGLLLLTSLLNHPATLLASKRCARQKQEGVIPYSMAHGAAPAVFITVFAVGPLQLGLPTIS